MKILVVEDDDTTRYMCETLLPTEGHRVTTVSTLADARSKLKSERFDLVLLDLQLPDGDGLSLIRQFRNFPPLKFLIMSIRGEPKERFSGLVEGAVDYLIKPFHPGELICRVERLSPDQEKQQTEHLRFGGWVLDFARRTLEDELGKAVELTRGEFDLLARLAQSKGRVLSRDSLLDTIARDESQGHLRSVDVLVSRLRRKIETDPTHPRYIITVTGLGYRFETVP